MMAEMSINFDLGFDGEASVLQHVAPNLGRLVANNPSKFTFRGTGTFILGTADSAVVIDPGPALDAHYDGLLKATAGLSVDYVAVTHTHRDHSPLAKRFATAVGATVVGCGPHPSVPEPDPTDIIDFGIDESDEVELARGAYTSASDDSDPESPHINHRDGGIDLDYRPDTQMTHGDTIAGDGWTLEAVHTPGHTSNHLCFAWHEASALFTGDHVMGWSTSVIGPPDGHMGHYLDSLELLLDREDEVYWPTHGNPIRNPHEFVRGLLAHRRHREQQLIDSVGNGVSTIEAMVRMHYTHVNSKLWPAAARSVQAHLIGLVDSGRLTSSSGTSRLTDEYSLNR